MNDRDAAIFWFGAVSHFAGIVTILASAVTVHPSRERASAWFMAATFSIWAVCLVTTIVLSVRRRRARKKAARSDSSEQSE